MDAAGTRRPVPLPEDVGAGRDALEALLGQTGWRGDVDLVLIAVHEALINADRHGGGIRSVAAEFRGREVHVEVRDHGAPFDAGPYVASEPDPLAERGRGLWLIHRIATSVRTAHDGAGNRLRITFGSRERPERAAPARVSGDLPDFEIAALHLLDALGAAIVIMDTRLRVRRVSGDVAELFGMGEDDVLGRDARALIAEVKHRFADPGAFESLALDSYAHIEEPRQQVCLLADGRLLRRHSVPLRDATGRLVGRMSAYLPVPEASQLMADLQRSTLPQAPAWEGVEVAAVYHPAELEAVVGGDFYDFLDLSDGRRCVVVGDVAGRGPNASAASTSVRAYLRASLEGYAVAEALARTDETLDDQLDDEQFVTALVCVEEAEGWVLTSCGHVPGLLVREGKPEALDAQGPALGAGVGGPWPTASLRLGPGDTLLLYTDGATRAGRRGRHFGVERLEEALRDTSGLPAREVVGAIDERIREFAGPTLDDDYVLLALRSG